MTRSGPNNNRSSRGPRLPQWLGSLSGFGRDLLARGPRFPQWLTNTTSAAWEILRATKYAEMRRESEEKIRQKIEDEARLRRLMEQNLGQERDDYIRNYIEEKLNNVVEKYKDESIKQIENELKINKYKLSNKIKGQLRTEQKELNDKINEELEEIQKELKAKIQKELERDSRKLKKIKKNLKKE